MGEVLSYLLPKCNGSYTPADELELDAQEARTADRAMERARQLGEQPLEE